MPAAKGSVSLWIDRLKAGHDDAAAALWQRYFTRLVGLAHKQLAGVPYRNDEAEDVAVSAFHGFCSRAGAGGFRRLEDRDDLWKLLAVLATRKAVSARRREGAAKRGAGQVLTVSELAAGPDGRAVDLFGDLADGGPTPAEAAAAAEEVRRLLRLLGDEGLRQVARARLEGYSNEEIGDRLGMALATVERKLMRVRAKWQTELVG
jgi:DNA-directed RNA polymerase specialized sigma24 family protein